MKLNPQNISSDLDRYEIALGDRGYLLSVGYARALAYRLPMPTSPVADPYTYFAETHKAEIEETLGQINEKVVINIGAAADLTQRLWLFRYRLIFDCCNAAVRSFMDAMLKVGTRELPPAVSELLIRYEASDVLELVAKSCDDSLGE